MRILHTSDWHLGATLKEHPRDFEHKRFLDWLTDLVVEREVDAVLLAGDLFDVANPSHRALALWYGWLEGMHRRAPHTTIVVIGGNHDSAARLDGPKGLLRALRIHVVGGLAEGAALDDLVIPLRDRDGEVRAVVGAVPFLGAASAERVAEVYADVAERLRAVAGSTQGLILMGHLAVAGQRSRDSEREMSGGLENVSLSTFPAEVGYVALGHLHLAQAPAPGVVYSGSPLPFSFAEESYEHQVTVIDVLARAGERPEFKPAAVLVPRAVQMQTWPTTGAMSVAEAMLRVGALPEARGDGETLPLVQIRLCAGSDAADQRDLEEHARKRDIRLLAIAIEAPAIPNTAEVRARRLSEVTPRDVFEDAWATAHAAEALPERVKLAFEAAVVRWQEESA